MHEYQEMLQDSAEETILPVEELETKLDKELDDSEHVIEEVVEISVDEAKPEEVLTSDEDSQKKPKRKKRKAEEGS